MINEYDESQYDLISFPQLFLIFICSLFSIAYMVEFAEVMWIAIHQPNWRTHMILLTITAIVCVTIIACVKITQDHKLKMAQLKNKPCKCASKKDTEIKPVKENKDDD